MKNPIKIVEAIPLTVHNGDSDASLEGDAIDMRPSDYLAFEGALVAVQIGTVGGDVSEALVKVEESDSSTFASGNTIAEGGEAVDVTAGESITTFQIKRTKRYIRVVLDIDEDGAADDVQISAVAVLNNWSKPYNLG